MTNIRTMMFPLAILFGVFFLVSSVDENSHTVLMSEASDPVSISL